MTTLILFLVLSGFFMFYTTSAKQVQAESMKLEQLISSQPVISKIAGSLLFLGALIFTISYYGLGSGILNFTIMIMTIGSMVIVLRPLDVINYKAVILLTLLSFLLEQTV